MVYKEEENGWRGIDSYFCYRDLDVSLLFVLGELGFVLWISYVYL